MTAYIVLLCFVSLWIKSQTREPLRSVRSISFGAGNAYDTTLTSFWRAGRLVSCWEPTPTDQSGPI
jgi:hypothetical protein